MEKKRRIQVAIYVSFLAIWLCFSVFAYAVLTTSQTNIFNFQIEADESFLKELIGWELRRQTTWAVLMIPSLLGIFSLIKHLKDYQSTYRQFLISLAYLGCALFLSYCILKLLRSYQMIRLYEVLLGRTSGIADPVQCFLFASNGTMETRGMAIISALIGLIATWLFQVFQSGFPERGEINKEKEKAVERAITLLEKENKDISPDATTRRKRRARKLQPT